MKGYNVLKEVQTAIKGAYHKVISTRYEGESLETTMREVNDVVHSLKLDAKVRVFGRALGRATGGGGR